MYNYKVIYIYASRTMNEFCPFSKSVENQSLVANYTTLTDLSRRVELWQLNRHLKKKQCYIGPSFISEIKPCLIVLYNNYFYRYKNMCFFHTKKWTQMYINFSYISVRHFSHVKPKSLDKHVSFWTPVRLKVLMSVLERISFKTLIPRYVESSSVRLGAFKEVYKNKPQTPCSPSVFKHRQVWEWNFVFLFIYSV